MFAGITNNNFSINYEMTVWFNLMKFYYVRMEFSRMFITSLFAKTAQTTLVEKQIICQNLSH